jgi:hypothetical protein
MRHLSKRSVLLAALLMLPAGAAWGVRRIGALQATSRALVRPTPPVNAAKPPSTSSSPSKPIKQEGGTGTLGTDALTKSLLRLRGGSSDGKPASTGERTPAPKNRSLISVFSPRNAFARTYFSNQSLAAVYFKKIIKNISRKGAAGRIWGQTFGAYVMTDTNLSGTRINRMNVSAVSKNQVVYRGPNGESIELAISGHYRIKDAREKVAQEGYLGGSEVREVRESWVGTPSINKIDKMHKQISLVLGDARKNAKNGEVRGKYFLTYLHSPIPYLQSPVHTDHEDAKMVGQMLVRSNKKTGEVSAICPAGVEVRIKPDGTYRVFKSNVNFQNPGEHPASSLYTDGRKLQHSGKLTRFELSELRKLADDPSACPIGDAVVEMGDGNC